MKDLRRTNLFHLKVGSSGRHDVWPVLVHIHESAQSKLNQDVPGFLSELWALVQANHKLLFIADDAHSKTRGEENPRLVGERVQLVYTRRSTSPQLTCMTYGAESSAEFGYLPLSRTTLVLWVYPYDPADPSRLPGTDTMPSCESELITNFFSKSQSSSSQVDQVTSVPSQLGHRSRDRDEDGHDSDATIDEPPRTSGHPHAMDIDEDSVLQSVLARSLQER